MSVYKVKKTKKKRFGVGYVIFRDWIHICKKQFRIERCDAVRYLDNVIKTKNII